MAERKQGTQIDSSLDPGTLRGPSTSFVIWVLGSAGLLGLALLLVFFWVPDIEGLGPDGKIFFFHVPAAWLMLLSGVVAGGAGAWGLATGRLSSSFGPAVELAALFGLVVMVTGPLWAWRAWGTPWVWEPRLTTSLVCWLTFLGAAGLNASKSRARKQTAQILALMGALEAPLVYLSVQWWRGAHHPPKTLVFHLGGRLAVGLVAALLASTALWALLFVMGRRLERLEDHIARAEALALRSGRLTARLGLLLAVVGLSGPARAQGQAQAPGARANRTPRLRRARSAPHATKAPNEEARPSRALRPRAGGSARASGMTPRPARRAEGGLRPHEPASSHAAPAVSERHGARTRAPKTPPRAAGGLRPHEPPSHAAPAVSERHGARTLAPKTPPRAAGGLRPHEPPSQAAPAASERHGARTRAPKTPPRAAGGFRPYQPPSRAGRSPKRHGASYAAVVAAYLALWAIIFLYLLRLERARRSLEARLAALEESLGKPGDAREHRDA